MTDCLQPCQPSHRELYGAVLVSSTTKRILSTTCIALSLVIGICSAAFAHAHLVKSSPAAGATIRVAPSELTLWFSEAVEGVFCTVEVVDEAGGRVDAGNVTVDAKDPKVLHVALKPLAKHRYKVIWKAVSVDSHTTNGNFMFTVAP
jgi:copper resistance protein C